MELNLAIIQCVNGTYTIAAEGIKTEQQGIVNFHNKCATLWNASDVKIATVMLVDSNLNVYGGYKEIIVHEETPSEEA